MGDERGLRITPLASLLDSSWFYSILFHEEFFDD